MEKHAYKNIKERYPENPENANEGVKFDGVKEMEVALSANAFCALSVLNLTHFFIIVKNVEDVPTLCSCNATEIVIEIDENR